MPSIFDSVPLTAAQVDDVNNVRSCFKGLQSLLEQTNSAKNPRYAQMCSRALEDACMYMVKAISHAAPTEEVVKAKEAPKCSEGAEPAKSGCCGEEAAPAQVPA